MPSMQENKSRMVANALNRGSSKVPINQSARGLTVPGLLASVARAHDKIFALHSSFLALDNSLNLSSQCDEIDCCATFEFYSATTISPVNS
jgi:hypothetical protein